MTRLGGLFGSVNETASFIGPAIGGLLIALIGAAERARRRLAHFLVAFALVARSCRAPEPAAGLGRPGAGGGALDWGNRPLRLRVTGLPSRRSGSRRWWPRCRSPRYPLRRQRAGRRVAAGVLRARVRHRGLVSSRAKSIDDRVATLAIVALAVSTWPLVFELPAWAVAVSVGVNGICSGLFFPRFFSALTIRTPIELRARVTASAHTLLSATGPLGFVGAGLLLHGSQSATAGFVLVVAATTVGAAIVAAGGRFSEPAPREPSPAALPADPPSG